jgi:hypothetical protein
MKIPFIKEDLDMWHTRYKVHGGWIVHSFVGSVIKPDESILKTSVFVRDPEHKWEV